MPGQASVMVLIMSECWDFKCQDKLEQLERLRFEIPPVESPIQVIHIRSQVKRGQSQSYKFKKKNFQKFKLLNLAKYFTRITPSEVV